MEEAVEAVWESLEAGLLRFANSDEHFWIEPCGTTAGERRAARKVTRELIKNRKADGAAKAAQSPPRTPQRPGGDGVVA